MLALLAAGLYGLHAYNNVGNVDNVQQHFREKGMLGARSFTKTAQERGVPRIPLATRVEQPPEVRRLMPSLDYVEPAHLTAARLDRLYEAMPDGPTGFAVKSINKNRFIETQRVPHHHPGLTRVGAQPGNQPLPRLY
jgi:hypothetical protein